MELVAWRSYRRSALWRDNEENAILTNSSRLLDDADTPPSSPHSTPHLNYGSASDRSRDSELYNGEDRKYVFYDSSLTTDDDDVNFLSRDTKRREQQPVAVVTARPDGQGDQANGHIQNKGRGAGEDVNDRRPVLQLMHSTESDAMY